MPPSWARFPNRCVTDSALPSPGPPTRPTGGPLMSQSTALIPLRPATTLGQLQSRPGLPFAEYLPAALIRRTAQRVHYCFRERIYTPAVTLWTFLSQVIDADHSCR